MFTHLIDQAYALSDRNLMAHLETLAGRERRASVELIAHLAILDTRPTLYAADGYGSLFRYCTEALHLSENAASNRIDAARACRRFPVILDLLAAGDLSVSAVRVIGRHLTAENHAAVLRRASGRGRLALLQLVAEIAPQPDAAPVIRRVAAQPVSARAEAEPRPTAAAIQSDTGLVLSLSPPVAHIASTLIAPPPVVSARPLTLEAPPATSAVLPTAPDSFRLHMTIRGATHDTLRQVQALMRRELPSGDPAEIFDQALSLLLRKLEKQKLGAADRPRPRGAGASAPSIRTGADRKAFRPCRREAGGVGAR